VWVLPALDQLTDRGHTSRPQQLAQLDQVVSGLIGAVAGSAGGAGRRDQEGTLPSAP
jgi:hypothetical protein